MYQQRIRDIYERLSPTYRRIADFLVRNYRDAAFMTAAQLARSVAADTTSVVRFAQRLGYPGYPELIAQVQEEVKADLRKIYEPPGGDQSAANSFRESLLADRNNLDYILQHNEPAALEKIIAIIGSARQVFVAGEAAATYIAEVLALRLNTIGVNAWALGGDVLGRLAMVINLQAEDAVLGIAPTAAASGIAAVLKLARENGAQTIAVAGTAANRAALVAEHVIYAPAHGAGLFYSPASVTAVVHALSQAIALQRSDLSADWALRADRLLQRYEEIIREEPATRMHDVISAINPGRDPDENQAPAQSELLSPDPQP